MDNKTERYMIIFNDNGLTIKGYYQEIISPIQRKKILDRLYSLIHRELFEGLQPLETETATQGNTTVLPTPQTTTALQPELRVKRAYKKHKHRKNKVKSAPMPETLVPEVNISTQPPNPEPTSNIKDPFDNEKDDNQYGEFKKKGLI